MTGEVDKLNMEIAQVDATITSLREKISPLQAKLMRQIKLREKKVERRDMLEIASKDPDKLDWALIMDGLHGNSVVKLREQERQLATLSLRRSGYRVDNGQTSIQIALTKGNPEHTEAVLKGLRKALPHIDWVAKIDGQPVQIFDHNLHEDGGWQLSIRKDGSVMLINSGRVYSSLNEEFISLPCALAYCEKHHWYDEV